MHRRDLQIIFPTVAIAPIAQNAISRQESFRIIISRNFRQHWMSESSGALPGSELHPQTAFGHHFWRSLP
jgi:hypothetical protein